MNYNSIAICQKSNEKPFIVCINKNDSENIVEDSLERFKNHYKDTEIHILSSWIEESTIDNPESEEFYKRICHNYMNTVCSQILIENPINDSVIHAYITDKAIEFKEEGKIRFDNFHDYLEDEESYYEYETYEDFYENIVKDCILEDIRDLGLFNGDNNEWNFYISYNDMILLKMGDQVDESIKEEIAEDFEIDNEEEIT